MYIKRVFSLLLAFLPLLLTILILPILPDRIPAHFDLVGNITRYGSKFESLIMPIITIVMSFFWLWMEKIAGKAKEKNVRNAKIMYWCSIGTTLFFAVNQIMFLFPAFTSVDSPSSDRFDIMRVFAVCIGVLCIFFGGIFPKCTQNYIIGIRTTWTLSSELSWQKTHKLAGYILFIYGILSTLFSLFVFEGLSALAIVGSGVLVVFIPIIIYSHYVYKHEKN